LWWWDVARARVQPRVEGAAKSVMLLSALIAGRPPDDTAASSASNYAKISVWSL